MTCNLSKIVSPAFSVSHRKVKSGEINELIEKGGRGSAKSSYISVELVFQLLHHPDCHAVVLRRVGNTLRTSVYAQVCWAIAELGLIDKFRCTTSPMECTYKKTGQKILFFGLDDPGKLKSIKLPFGYIGFAWFEELDQFAGPEQVRNVEQSVFRGGPYSFCFKSFNPPITRDNWANKYALEEKDGLYVHHSTYLTTPEKWLGPRFLADADHLKAADERAYRHEYLGEAVGTGGNVFDKLELREITDEEIASFDRIYQGVDWGWFPDPFAFIRLHYDRNRETIYLLDEIYKNKLPNDAAAAEIKEKGYTDAYITCDNAEPKSIFDFRDFGLPAKEAIKGPGSVDYGMKWLQKRTIVIDRRRTPNAYNEFVNYEYERDKDGEIISGYPDADNHLIDGTRYALERVYRRRGATA